MSAEEENVSSEVAEVENKKKLEDTEAEKKKDKGPSLFTLMGQDQNKHVYNAFIAVSVLLCVAGFGSFWVVREFLPKFTSIQRKDASIYGAIVALVLTQVVIISFIFYARKYDLEHDEKQKTD